MDGLKAANNWLSNLEPGKEERRRKKYQEFCRNIEAALQRDKDLSIAFREVLTIARWLGRVDGLREGLELYEYGERILESKPPAFLTAMRYAVSNPKNVSTPEICDYLDHEIQRIEQLKTADVRIRPPKQWGCKTWNEALKKKRNNLDVLFSEVRKEAESQAFATLCAWATWRVKARKKSTRAGSKD